MHDGDVIVLQFEDLCTKRGAVGSLPLWNLHKSYTVVKYDKIIIFLIILGISM